MVLGGRSRADQAWSQGKVTEGARYILNSSKLFSALLMRAGYHLHMVSVPDTPFRYLAEQLNSCNSFRIRSSVRAYVPPLVAQLDLSNGMPTFSAFLPGTKSKVRACHSSRTGHFYHLSTCRPCPGRSRARCASVPATRGDNGP